MAEEIIRGADESRRRKLKLAAKTIAFVGLLGFFLIALFFIVRFTLLNHNSRCVRIKPLRSAFLAGVILVLVQAVLTSCALALCLLKPEDNIDDDCCFDLCVSFSLVVPLLLVIFIFVFPIRISRDITHYQQPAAAAGSDHPRLDGFSSELRAAAGRWDDIIPCLAPSIGCDRFSQTNDHTSSQQYLSSHLHSLQRKCCMAPPECGLSFVNATSSVPPTSSSNQSYSDVDCTVWNNDPTKLCYACDSCKQGILSEVRKKGRIASNLLLIIGVIFGCIELYKSIKIYTN